MRRTARKSLGSVVYHVLNRGNGRQRLFHKPADDDAFVKLLAELDKGDKLDKGDIHICTVTRKCECPL